MGGKRSGTVGPERRPGPEHLHLLDQFSLKVMGDIAQFFVHNRVRNFYSCPSAATTSPKPGLTDQPAGLQRSATALPVEVSRTRHAHRRRLRAQPVFFFSNGMEEYTVMAVSPAASGLWR
jgi:methylmalonyl-CoA mutase